MASHADYPLPLAQQPADAPDPWALERPEPTTLIALWPGTEAPTKSEVVAAIEHQADGRLHEVEELNGALWNGVFETPFAMHPMILWADRAEPLPPDELTDVPDARHCKWIVGVETILGDDPHADFANILRALARVADGPGILDPTTGQWWLRQQLEDLVADPPAELPVEALWTIHAVSDRRVGEGDGTVWLHTHGLRRCNRPELEMLDVPRERSSAAATLLNELAALALESPLPDPGELWTVGSGLDVTLQPCREIASSVTAQHLGGTKDREGEDNPHAGVSAVVCAPKPKGLYRRLWTWPAEAVEKLTDKDAAFFRTARQTQRQAELAQSRWGELATAHAAILRSFADAAHNQRPVVLLKAGMVEDGNDPDRREHLWFKVSTFQGDQANAELISQPMYIRRLKKGDLHDVQRSTVSDWSVVLPAGRFGPHDVPALWRAIEGQPIKSQKGA